MGWTDVSTWRILALMATHCRCVVVPLNHPKAGRKGMSGDGVLMRHRAGHFAGAAPNAFFRIRHDKSVNLLRLAHVKIQFF